MPLHLFSRRGLLCSAALGPLALLGSCGGGGRRAPMGEGDAGTALADRDEALGFVLAEMEGAYGEPFELRLMEDEVVDEGVRSWNQLLSPASDPRKAFSSTVVVDAGTLALREGPYANYSQYLFKEAAEGPYLDALARCEGLAGYAATLTSARYDARVWREGDFDEYMGRGRMGDPAVCVVVMLPGDGDLDSWSRTAQPCLECLYAIEMNIKPYLAVEGTDPFRNPLYGPDVDYMYAGSRREDAPSQKELREDFESLYLRSGQTTQWDGDGFGDGLPHDPARKFHRPHITWNPGYGPEHW